MDENACRIAQTNWNQALYAYRNNKEQMAEFDRKLRNAGATIADKESSVNDLGQKLYYIQEKIDAKKAKIAELAGARDGEPDPDRRGQIQNEIDALEREKSDLEYDRRNEKNTRDDLLREIEQLKNEQERTQEERSRTQDAKRKHYDQLQEAKRVIDENCPDASSYTLPYE